MLAQLKDSSQCSGCTACVSVCTRNAIEMKPDALGFLYPFVDEEKCNHCGRCEKVCAFHQNYDKSSNLEKPLAYAVRHREIEEVERSRSGAAFVALSDYIIEQGGVVYGAAFDREFRVVHKKALTKKERDEFRGSKYVQSDLTGIFQQVKDDLRRGTVVLFSGTPCQTAGLHSFLPSSLRQHLYLLDIVCHGVPGPKIWKDYLDYLQKKENDSIVEVNFRNKNLYGWYAHRETYVFAKKRIITKKLFTNFYKHPMFRHSCENCYYTNLKRPSDITLADFWQCEHVVPEMNRDNQGVSLVLCNTNKGYELFGKVEPQIVFSPVELENCMQHNLKSPTVMDPRRASFERDYARYGFVTTMKKYGFIGIRYKMGRFFSNIKKMCNKINRKR